MVSWKKKTNLNSTRLCWAFCGSIWN